MEATTEFHQRVNTLNNTATLLKEHRLTGSVHWLVVFGLCLGDDITRKPTWNTTTWRSTRRWTCRWPRSKPSWSLSSWRPFATSQVNVLHLLHRQNDSSVSHSWLDDQCWGRVWLKRSLLCSSPATVFSCLAIALGVYRLWRWRTHVKTPADSSYSYSTQSSSSGHCWRMKRWLLILKRVAASKCHIKQIHVASVQVLEYYHKLKVPEHIL